MVSRTSRKSAKLYPFLIRIFSTLFADPSVLCETLLDFRKVLEFEETNKIGVIEGSVILRRLGKFSPRSSKIDAFWTMPKRP